RVADGPDGVIQPTAKATVTQMAPELARRFASIGSTAWPASVATPVSRPTMTDVTAQPACRRMAGAVALVMWPLWLEGRFDTWSMLCRVISCRGRAPSGRSHIESEGGPAARWK